MQIIILGMHRSGTSSVTRLVNMMGAYVGADSDMVVANPENPKGFWERNDVISINNQLLQAQTCQWFHLDGWTANDASTPLKASDEIDTQIDTLLTNLNTHKHCVIKDPRMCHTLPYWIEHLDNPFFVLVHRDPMEIATSLHTRNGYSMEHGIALWDYAATGMLNAVQPHAHTFINYADLMQDPITTTHTLFAALNAHQAGLKKLSDNSITDFIDPSLYRSKANKQPSLLSAEQQVTCELFNTQILPEKPLSPSPSAQKTMKDLSAYIDVFTKEEEVKHTLGCANATIDEQRVRIEALMAERDDYRTNLEHCQKDKDDLTIEKNTLLEQSQQLQQAVHALGLDKLERDNMKATRWWKLRSWLRREDGITLKELISPAK